MAISEEEGTTTYTYDTKTKGKGMIASIAGPGGVSKEYSYDEYSRIASVTETIDGRDFTETLDYDDYGRLSELTYPSGFGVTYNYNNYYYLSEVNRADNQSMIWEAEEMNERLQIEQFKSGNNLVTNQSFDIGFITGIQTGSIQDFEYEWDMATGNLKWRKDANRDLIENFSYDNVNRLIKDSIEGGTAMNFGYSANGNIDSTTLTGIYTYSPSMPHAVSSVTNPYEIISTANQEIEYTSFNKAQNIVEGINELNITYGVDKERRKMEKYEDESLVLTRYYSHFNYERDSSSGIVSERHYISGGNGLAAIFVKEGEDENMYYIHKDHLGSYNCITDSLGAIVQELSFDAWGRRRNPDDWTYSDADTTFIFDRGYTGHEHLDEYGLINMNGRMYSPLVGRFLSPDILVQHPGNTQSYNRYSYCLNNPLKYTDPSGYYDDSKTDRYLSRWHQHLDGGAYFSTPSNGFNYGRYSSSRSLPGVRTDTRGLWLRDSEYEPSSYYYDWETGTYRNGNGDIVPFEQVHNNYIIPNTAYTYVYHWSAKSVILKDEETGFLYPGWEKINECWRIEPSNYGSWAAWDRNGDGWHPPMALPNGKDILDGTAKILSHPGTGIALQLGDDALRAIGLAKAIPGINIIANATGAYVYSSDMSNPNLSVERKAYRTLSNGVPFILGTGAMIGAFGTGAGELAVIIGAVGWAGEQVYDRAIYPALKYTSQKVYEFETWFKSGGYNSMYSDENLKYHITPIDSSLYKVLVLNGYAFNWKDSIYSDTTKHDIGLIAQEVEKVYPSLVTSDSIGNKKIYYYKLIPVLIEALKDQQEIINNQDILLKEYQNKFEYNEKILNGVLIRLDELEYIKKKKSK